MGKIRLKMGKYCKIRVFPGKTTALYRKFGYRTLPKIATALYRKIYRSSPKNIAQFSEKLPQFSEKLPQFTEKATAVLRKSLAQFTEKL
jgi:hypothetical protein